ncbi:MAG: DUF1987 domain-containing protein [Magnetococcus sp. YQC-5]
MDTMIINETKSSPKITLDAVNGFFEICGVSFPENSSKIYDPVYHWIEQYLKSSDNKKFVLEMRIDYFNSSTSKAFLDIFDLLEEAAENGWQIVINWHYHTENDMARVYGEQFKMDITKADFCLLETLE